MTSKIDRGLYSSGYRTFNSEGKLICWIDHRCSKCGKFIKAIFRGKNTCKECSEKNIKEYHKLYNKNKRPYLSKEERKLLKNIK